MPKHLFFSLALAVLVLAEPAARQQTPTFRSGAQIVEIDVRVFDREGRFVTGLTRDDFQVIEDGEPQQLQTFFFVDDPGGVGSQARQGSDPVQTPSDDRRPRQTWIFFFDLNHLTPGGGYDRARKAVEDFVRDRFRDGDVAGILAGDKMINNRLTSVRQELLDGIKQVKPLSDSRNRMIELSREWPRLLNEEEALLVARNDREALQRAVIRACSDDPDACRMAPPDAALMSKAQRLRQEIDRASRATMATISRLASGLAKIPGPKTVVFLSDGFVTQELETTLRGVVGQAGRAGARVYAIDVRGLARGGPDPGQLAAENPAGAMPKFDSIADGPSSLAIDTGGMMIRNENNIGRALETIATDANSYYVLGFQPSNTNWDGKFRPVQVRVKREGVRVRARRGYLALEPAGMLLLPQSVRPPLPATAPDAEAAPPRAPLSTVPASPEVSPALGAAPAAAPAAPATVPAPATIRLRPDVVAKVRGLAKSPAPGEDAAARGWDAYQRGDLEAAIGPLELAAAAPEARPWVLYALGFAQTGLSRPGDAAATWERLRREAPDFASVYMDLAATYIALSDLTKALGVLRDAEGRWPKDAEVHNALGVIHFKRGALDEAISAFATAAEVAPNDPTAYLNLGRGYEMRYVRSRRYVTSQRIWTSDEGDRQRAIAHYQRYLRLGGPYADAARKALEGLEWAK